MVSREETIAPITGLQGLTASAAGKHYERGQVVVLAAQPVAEPGANGRSPGLLMAGAEEGDRRVMIDRLRKHRTDDGDFIHDAADVRQQLAQLNAAFSIGFEWIGRADTQKRLLAGGHARDALAHAHAWREFFASHLGELRLRIEQVNVRRPSARSEARSARLWPSVKDLSPPRLQRGRDATARLARWPRGRWCCERGTPGG